MPVEWTVVVGPLLATVNVVMQAAATARRYRKKCELLRGRLQLISKHLEALKKANWTPEPEATTDALKCLSQVMERAEKLVESCQRKKVFGFLWAVKKKDEFDFVDKRISHITDSFHLANHALILLSYSDRIFMVVLDTLIQDGACKRLAQDKKEVLKKSMSKLSPSSDNMPPEKKRTLESIKTDLMVDAGWSSLSAYRSLMHQDRQLLEQVADLGKRIMEEANVVSHNKEQVQRLAQLAYKVVYCLLPHLQPKLLTQGKTKQLVENLKDNLGGALEVITQSGPFTCVPPGMNRAASFWRKQAKQMAALGNKIEGGYQTLTLMIVNSA